MTALIIDSNPLDSAKIKRFAHQVDDLEIVCECCNTIDAYKHLQTKPVDLLFLDIGTDGISGIELTHILKNKNIAVIFISSKKDYASDAFEYNATDYLIKPITEFRFLQAIEKARTIVSRNHARFDTSANDFIFIRDGATIRRLKLDDIIFTEAMGDYVKFHTEQKTYAIHCTMRAAEERLPASNFFRIHRSFIVALNKIDSFQDGGIVMGSRFLPVAGNYKKILHQRLNIL